MKKITTTLFCFLSAILILSGCDDVKNDEREKPKETVFIHKTVLLLDFADQNCPYCPRANEEAATLKSRYRDSLVVVTIHAYPTNLPLVTETGNEYDRHFEIQKIGHPVGIIDGTFTPEYYDWEAVIVKRFNITPSVSIDLKATFDKGNRTVSLVSHLKGLQKIENAKLLLWVVENNIIDRQKLLNGSVDTYYKHQHILREAINGMWGEAVALGVNEEKTLKSEFTLAENLKAEDISIVAFVYNTVTDEALNVAEITINN
ncbi:MAG: Omp28 family outer membrane lipoprotein [Tannerella sp.]|jgi:thiol-disulfide isomerase/thioredoxin|nr:Omp28 family outer membrane lipoprotein [Tannerella sp.]